MSHTESGRVQSVEVDVRASALSVQTAPGDTTLYVDDTSPFDEDGGTIQLIDGATTELVEYSSVDDELLTLSLTSELANTYPESAVVRIPGAATRYAMVRLDDTAGEAIAAVIPHALIQRLPEGVRDLDDLDAVSVQETTPGVWIVRDVLGRELAASGTLETDWRNSKGISLIGGDLDADVAEAVYGINVVSAEIVAECNAANGVTLPAGTDGSWRKIGTGGAGTGAIPIEVDFPVKVIVSAIASVLNDTDTGWNVRMYCGFENPDTGETFLGRQATQWCSSNDTDPPESHRQVTNLRQLYFDASPDNPIRLNAWWGFRNDSGVSRAADLRNLKMTLRVSYAPDIPTVTQPDREPQWTTSAAMKASYINLESELENPVP